MRKLPEATGASIEVTVLALKCRPPAGILTLAGWYKPVPEQLPHLTGVFIVRETPTLTCLSALVTVSLMRVVTLSPRPRPRGPASIPSNLCIVVAKVREAEQAG